jgi:hypothetical protein
MVCERDRIGTAFRGQAWVALHGDFTIEQLKALIKVLEENCKGLERKDVDTRRPNHRLDSEPTNN